MKPLQFIIIIVVIVLAWASLFITVLSQSSKTNQLVTNDHKLLTNDTTIIKQQKLTIDILSGRIGDLGTHIDCLFNLATQPNHATAHISDAATCTISSTTGTPGAGAPAASPQPSKVSSSPQSAPNSGNTQTNNPQPKKPAKSIICNLTIGLVGCK